MPLPVQRLRLCLVVGATCLNGLVPSAVIPAMPAIARELGSGFNAALIAQMVMAGPGYMVLAGGLLAGPLLRRLGPARLMGAMLAAYTLLGLAGLALQDLPLLILSRLALGFASGCLSSAAIAQLADWWSGSERDRVLGYVTGAASLASAAGLLAGGWLAERWGWHAAFSLYALGAPLLLVVPRVFAGTPRPAPSAAARRRAPVGAAWLPLGVLFAAGPALQAWTAQGPFLLEARGITGAATQGALVSASLFATVLSAAAVGTLRRWFAPLPLLTAAMAGLGLALVASSLPQAPLALLLACTACGLCGGVALPLFKSAVLGRAVPEARPLVAGLLMAALYAGAASAPLVLNPLGRLFGTAGAFTAIGLIAIVGALAVAVLSSPSGRRQDRRPDVAR